MIFAVCGPPRSGTTAMLELVAAWTTLAVRWDLGVEWATRSQTGLRERFYETTPSTAVAAGVVTKVLDPAALPPWLTRAILMIRDPEQVSHSAIKIGQRISPQEVMERVEAFRTAHPALDEVRVEELSNPAVLFARLAATGWPRPDGRSRHRRSRWK